MPELTCTKLVIYLDIQLFLIGKSPFSLQDTALFAPQKRNLQCTLVKRIRQADKQNNTAPRADHAR